MTEEDKSSPKATDPIADSDARAEQSRPPDSSEQIEAQRDQPPGASARGGDATRRRGSTLGAMGLLFALLACAGVGWLWWQDFSEARQETALTDWQAVIDRQSESQSRQLEQQLQQLRQDLQQELDQTDSELRRDVDRLGRQVEQASAAAEAATAGNERSEAALRQELRSLQRRFEVVEKSVTQLANLNRNSRDELLLAEAEFLMRLAAERLTLFEDPRNALQALKMADEHLRAVEDPLYGSAREALSAEIQQLQSVALPDRAAISGQLLQLAEAATGWPLDRRRTLDHSGNWITPADADADWWSRTRKVISELVVVHRDTGEATMMLTLDESRRLRENLRLQLQIAQLAAVRGEAELYHSSLDAVQQWLNDYFDLETMAIKEAQDRLSRLQQVEIDPEMPTLGRALRELTGLRATHALSEEGL